MKAWLFLTGLLMVAAISVACARSGDAPAEFEAGFAEDLAFESAPMESAGEATGVTFSDARMVENAVKRSNIEDRLIIRTGRVDVVVEDSEESLLEISELAGAMGGWVVSSDIQQSDIAKSGNVTIRIPAQRFDETVSRIKELALEVLSESTSSQDVTEEYVDLTARLENLEATADRVRGFLETAKNTEEALAVNQELSRLEGEIEALKGRMQYLNQSAAFSTLTVHLTPDELSQPLELAGWQPQGVARTAIEALISTLQAIANVVIWGAIFCLPLVLLLAIPAYLVYRFGYRRWRLRREEEGEES